MLPVQIKVGGGGTNPVAGAAEWNEPLLKGVNGYIDKSGFGIWEFSNYQVLKSGGIRLLNGLTFSDTEVLSFVPVNAFYDATNTNGYTNGFNTSLVLSKLVGRVGWLQSPDVPELDILNSTSKGGRFFNDGSFHALVSLKNIFDTMEWAVSADEPTALEFNAYLTSVQRATVLRLLNGVFPEPEYVSQALAYTRWSGGNTDQPLPNNGKFVGYQIKVGNVVDLAFQIDSIGLYFDSDVTFPLYIFNDIKEQPIYTKEVTALANDQTIIELEDFILNFISSSNHGGTFYLGYFQDDLGGAKAIWETNIEFSNGNVYGLTTIESEATGSTFNKKLFQYTTRTNGLNPHISVFRDHTWQIIKKASLFDNGLGLQTAAWALETLIWTQRSNGTERGLKTAVDKVSASLDLNGVAPISDSPHTTGLKNMITQELNRLKKSFCPDPKPQSMTVC